MSAPHGARSWWERSGGTRLAAALFLCGAALVVDGLWIPLKAALAQTLLERAWHSTRATPGPPARPWPWADTWPVARLRLPAAHEPLIVLAGASGRNLAFAPAWLDGTAAPGDDGVSVIAAHRDTHFRVLEHLEIGDKLTVERRDGRSRAYEVVALDVVDATKTRLSLDAPDPVLALVTCYPFDALTAGGPLRYVVTAIALPP